jgi:hypothetical protein
MNGQAVNDVDTRDTTIEKYSQDIENEFISSDKHTQNNYHNQSTENVDYQETMTPLVHQCLKSTLRMFNITVENSITEDASRSYTALLLKYFPNASYLDTYKEEVGAILCTVALGSAISQQLQIKREIKERDEANIKQNDTIKNEEM